MPKGTWRWRTQDSEVFNYYLDIDDRARVIVSKDPGGSGTRWEVSEVGKYLTLQTVAQPEEFPGHNYLRWYLDIDLETIERKLAADPNAEELADVLIVNKNKEARGAHWAETEAAGDGYSFQSHGDTPVEHWYVDIIGKSVGLRKKGRRGARWNNIKPE